MFRLGRRRLTAVSAIDRSISHFATADEFTDTTLRILSVEKRQYGQYQCRAANKLGNDQASVELFGTLFALHWIVSRWCGERIENVAAVRFTLSLFLLSCPSIHAGSIFVASSLRVSLLPIVV